MCGKYMLTIMMLIAIGGVDCFGECHTMKQPLQDLLVELSMGDFIDKLTILQIKTERIKDPIKLRNIYLEQMFLNLIFKKTIKPSQEFEELYERLLSVNKRLWELEDLTRIKEREQQFDDEFRDYVLEIINNNDERARTKRVINELLGSSIVEEKSYTDLLENSLDNDIKRSISQQKSMVIAVPTPLADLADRITVLQIKQSRIHDEIKLEHINNELSVLKATLFNVVDDSDELAALLQDLRVANEEMWDVQDGLRACRRDANIDDEFTKLGRGVYHANDKRGAVKRRINQYFGSALVEEKSYALY